MHKGPKGGEMEVMEARGGRRGGCGGLTVKFSGQGKREQEEK